MTTTRRRLLQTTGGAAIASLTGCLGSVRGGGLDTLRVAYMPIYPDMQYFTLKAEGYLDDLPVDVAAAEFSDGPSIIQAYASGEFDVALFGVLPAQILIDKGIQVSAVAANDKNSIGIFTTEAFADRFARDGADAFETFRADTGRKFTFGTFPSGSVPDILLRYWFEETLDRTIDDVVDVIHMGAGKVRQALLANEIDGTSLLEPIPTIARLNGSPYTLLAEAAAFLPGGQPSAVTVMSHDLIENHRDVATQYLSAHVAATEFINENPAAAAQNATAVIGQDVLPLEVATAAMDSPLEAYITDVREILDGSQIYAEYAQRLGKLDTVVSNDDLYEFSLLDAVT